MLPPAVFTFSAPLPHSSSVSRSPRTSGETGLQRGGEETKACDVYTLIKPRDVNVYYIEPTASCQILVVLWVDLIAHAHVSSLLDNCLSRLPSAQTLSSHCSHPGATASAVRAAQTADACFACRPRGSRSHPRSSDGAPRSTHRCQF